MALMLFLIRWWDHAIAEHSQRPLEICVETYLCQVCRQLLLCYFSGGVVKVGVVTLFAQSGNRRCTKPVISTNITLEIHNQHYTCYVITVKF